MSFSATNTMLVIRFSSMGDVAMTVPVLRSLLSQHTSLRVLMVTQQNFAPLFAGIDRLQFIGADLQGSHRGILGLWKLFKLVYKISGAVPVADLHNVLRSKLFAFFFKMQGSSVVSLDKGRKEKRALTRQNQKVLKPLTSTFERYAQVFRSLGYPLQLDSNFLLKKRDQQAPIKIGFAPFAKHVGKSLPIPLAEQLIANLLESIPCQLFLFGAPGKEAAQLSIWEQTFPSAKNVAGQLELGEELQFISSLDLMITMDSANMHLASLVNTPVVSIWGATHPYAGFLGWGQSQNQVVQTDLACRPCSVFGNKPCFRGDYACMQQIQPQQIVQQVRSYLCIS